MEAKSIAKGITAAIIPLMASTAAYSAAVSTQTAPFHVRGTIPAVCFKADIASELAKDSSLPPDAGAAALSLLDAALAFAMVDFDAFGQLKINRHGQNGAVFHLDWAAALKQASLTFAATNTNALALAYADAKASAGPFEAVALTTLPTLSTAGVFATAFAIAKSGGFVAGLSDASASGIDASGNLAAMGNLASVDAANIKESRNIIGFYGSNFSFSKSTSEAGVNLSALESALAEAFSTACSFFGPSSIICSTSSYGNLDVSNANAQAAAKAVATALAKSRVLAVFGGYYKAMPGKASETDILEAGGAAALKVKCGADVELEVEARATAN